MLSIKTEHLWTLTNCFRPPSSSTNWRQISECPLVAESGPQNQAISSYLNVRFGEKGTLRYSFCSDLISTQFAHI